MVSENLQQHAQAIVTERKSATKRNFEAFRPFDFDSKSVMQCLENYYLLYQIGYLESEVLESAAIQNFVSYFSQLYSRQNGSNMQVMGNLPFETLLAGSMTLHKRSGGPGTSRAARMRRVEVSYEDLKSKGVS